MPTKEELQDENDELRLALERAREDAEELKGEVEALRGELDDSESRRLSLQSTLTAQSEAQRGMAEVYTEKEERLLARVRAEAGRMAEAGERWAAQEALLRGEVASHESTITGLRVELAGKEMQVQHQAVSIVDLSAELSKANQRLDVQRQTISGQNSQISQHGREMREALENRQSITAGILELLASKPGCWVVMTCAALMLGAAVYVINSIVEWLTPSQNLLGR